LNVTFDGQGSVFLNRSHTNENLGSLVIDSIYLKEIPTNDLKQFSKLRIFELKNSLLEELTPETLKFGKSIVMIRIDQNKKLRRISSKSFSNQQNLATLLIDGSNLTEIDPRAFGGLYKLMVLSLRNNQIESLHDDLFADLSRLTDLIVADNKIKMLPEILFRNNTNILRIDLNHNIIAQAHSEMFKNLTKLMNLNLLGNTCVDQEFKKTSEIQRGIAECHLNIYQDGTPKPNTFQPTSITALISICPIILVVIIILLILITHLILRTYKALM
jgi:Leucine-rich repeat (LRR) protein